MTEASARSLMEAAAREKFFLKGLEATKLAKGRARAQQAMLSDLKEIGKSGSLERIIAAEKSLVQFDLNEYANSKGMESSLKTAQEELAAIEINMGLVGDAKRYKIVDASNAQRKARDALDLPLDGARRAFRSHAARLGNYDKSKSDDHEKAIIQARQQNIRIAEKLYVERQEQALGRDIASGA